jgi:hypothetical protein
MFGGVKFGEHPLDLARYSGVTLRNRRIARVAVSFSLEGSTAGL